MRVRAAGPRCTGRLSRLHYCPSSRQRKIGFDESRQITRRLDTGAMMLAALVSYTPASPLHWCVRAGNVRWDARYGDTR